MTDDNNPLRAFYAQPDDGELVAVLRHEAYICSEFYDALKAGGLHESAIDAVLAAWFAVRFERDAE